MSTRILVCCGSGGVGKTTTAAALALGLAERGLRVAVLTIDPARRLADSLGIGPIGNTPQPVPISGSGKLDAMMLDMKATWDGVIRRFATSDELRDRILGNRYYRFTSTRLAGSHEYMAMERLYELYESEEYDVVLLDTPPSRHALEFLKAPDRMAGLMDEGVLHWLATPRTRRGFRALERGSEAIANVLKRLVGGETITEIAEFFGGFGQLWEGFHSRSLEVKEVLRGGQTRFLLVTTPAPAARAEAQSFVDFLAEEGFPLGGFLVNRVIPPPSSPDPDPLDAFPPRPAELPSETWDHIVDAVRGARPRQARLAQAEADWLDELGVSAGSAPVWRIPELDGEVHDLDVLRAIAAHLSPAADALITEA